jgi:hypothetical protein
MKFRCSGLFHNLTYPVEQGQKDQEKSPQGCCGLFVI